MPPDRPLRATAYVPKGGVTKTTSIAHIAVSASRDHDLDVLLVDLAGNQNDVATQFGIEDDVDDPDAPISAVFGEDWEFIRDNIENIVDRMVFDTGEGPDLIPADPGLSGADNNLANIAREERYTKLDAFIDEDLGDRYDLVLFDLPGKDDNITLNGIFAAENVIAPLRPGKFEIQQLENLHEELRELREAFDGSGGTPDVNPHVEIIIPTAIDQRENYHLEFVESLQERYPELTNGAVTKSANVGQLQNDGHSLFGVDEDELSTTGKRAREAYRDMTTEFLSRIQ